jgi:hypothetical protein
MPNSYEFSPDVVSQFKSGAFTFNFPASGVVKEADIYQFVYTPRAIQFTALTGAETTELNTYRDNLVETIALVGEGSKRVQAIASTGFTGANVAAKETRRGNAAARYQELATDLLPALLANTAALDKLAAQTKGGVAAAVVTAIAALT